MLTQSDRDRYDRDGFIVVPGVLSETEVAGLRAATDELVAKSRSVAAHNEVYDLEPGHTLEITVSYQPSQTLESALLIIQSDEQRTTDGVLTAELWGRIFNW